MSRSLHVYAIRAPDAKWKAMKAAYDACTLAGVAIPKEVDAFFEGDVPDPAGVLIDLRYSEAGPDGWKDHPCLRETEDDWGYEVDLSKLPKDVTTIRFTVV